MDHNMQIFENKQFGKIRTVEKDGEVWFVGVDVAKALGYFYFCTLTKVGLCIITGLRKQKAIY